MLECMTGRWKRCRLTRQACTCTISCHSERCIGPSASQTEKWHSEHLPHVRKCISLQHAFFFMDDIRQRCLWSSIAKGDGGAIAQVLPCANKSRQNSLKPYCGLTSSCTRTAVSIENLSSTPPGLCPTTSTPLILGASARSRIASAT